MNEKLVNLYKELAKTTELANQDLAGSDPRSRIGLETRKRNAQDNLPLVRNQLMSEISNSVVKVFLKGDLAKAIKFVTAAKTQGATVVSGDELYRKIAEPIEKTIDKKRTFGTSQVVRLIEELTDFARTNGIKELPMPKLDANLYNGGVATFEETTDMVRRAVRSTMADDLNKLFLEREALQKTLENKNTDSVIPVVVYRLSDTEVSGLSKTMFAGRPTVEIDLNEIEEDENFISNVIQKISEKFNAITK